MIEFLVTGSTVYWRWFIVVFFVFRFYVFIINVFVDWKRIRIISKGFYCFFWLGLINAFDMQLNSSKQFRHDSGLPCSEEVQSMDVPT